MIEFKEEFKEMLPYDRLQYVSFFHDDAVDGSIQWFGVSFQLPGTFEGVDIGLEKFVETFEPLFKKIILESDNGSSWIVNHQHTGAMWFPNDDNTLPHLRSLFKQNDVPNTFKGALI